MTRRDRVRRARSCAGRACIPATSWTGGGPGTAGRWRARQGLAGARPPIRGMRRSPGCARRRPGWSRSWPRPASWSMCSQNCHDMRVTPAIVGRSARAGASSTQGRQALLVLAYLPLGETFAELTAGFDVGTATAWRHVTEPVALLAARLRSCAGLWERPGRRARLHGDRGTLIPIDRVAAGRPFYSGKHRRHGMSHTCVGRGRTVHLIRDVLARPGLVLSRSNRVLTLRRILPCTKRNPPAWRSSYRSGRNRPCILTSLLPSSRIAAGLADVVRPPANFTNRAVGASPALSGVAAQTSAPRASASPRPTGTPAPGRGFSLRPHPCFASLPRGREANAHVPAPSSRRRHGVRPRPPRRRSRRHQEGATSARTDEPTAQRRHRVGPAPTRRLRPQTGPASSHRRRSHRTAPYRVGTAPLAKRSRGMKGYQQSRLATGHHDPAQPARVTSTLPAAQSTIPEVRGGESHCRHTRSSR